MITAKEARALYNQSGAEANAFLKNEVEKKVMDAANGGKKYTFIHLGSLGPHQYIEQTVTLVQRQVIEKLQELGYHAEFALDGPPYVPRGLANDDGRGPLHTNYGIRVGW